MSGSLRRVVAVGLTLAAIGIPARSAMAQLGVAIRGSTLGVGGEISYRAGRHFGLRGGANYLSFTRDATIEGIDYSLTPKLQNGTAIADIFPFGSAFHFSGGVVWNSNEGRVNARLDGPITINGQTYQPSDVGQLTGRFAYSTKYAPYAGVGFSGRGRVSLVLDLGVVFSGYPKATLTGTTNLSGQAKDVFDQNVESEQQKIQSEINKQGILKYHPVLSLGLRVGL